MTDERCREELDSAEGNDAAQVQGGEQHGVGQQLIKQRMDDAEHF